MLHVLPQLMQYIDVPLGGDRRLALTKEVAMTSPMLLATWVALYACPEEIEWILEKPEIRPYRRHRWHPLALKGFWSPPAEVFGPASLELNLSMQKHRRGRSTC